MKELLKILESKAKGFSDSKCFSLEDIENAVKEIRENNNGDLKKEFFSKFKEGLYPYVCEACTSKEIWDWIEEKFEAKRNEVKEPMPKIAEVIIPKSVDTLQKESFSFAISKVNWCRNKSPKYVIEDTELIRFAEYYNLYKSNFSV